MKDAEIFRACFSVAPAVRSFVKCSLQRLCTLRGAMDWNGACSSTLWLTALRCVSAEKTVIIYHVYHVVTVDASKLVGVCRCEVCSGIISTSGPRVFHCNGLWSCPPLFQSCFKLALSSVSAYIFHDP
jgi:hypothetical protein